MLNFKSKLVAIAEKETDKKERLYQMLKEYFGEIIEGVDKLLTNFDRKQWSIADLGDSDFHYILNDSVCPKSNGVVSSVCFRGEVLTVRFRIQNANLGVNFDIVDCVHTEEFCAAAQAVVDEIKATTDIEYLEVYNYGLMLASVR